MPTLSELYDRAAECERLMQLAADPGKRMAFKLLRDLWIALANESAHFDCVRLSEEIAAIMRLQAQAEKSVLH